jgi:hypothetical protein
MIRFSSLFLALNIFLCYGGLYRDAFAESSAPQANASSGCHGMSRENNAPESNTTSLIVNDSESRDGSCCQDTLTNAHPDLNTKIEIVTIDRSHPHVINESKTNLNKFLDGSPREHDPPDLQVSFSTFLL